MALLEAFSSELFFIYIYNMGYLVRADFYLFIYLLKKYYY